MLGYKKEESRNSFNTKKFHSQAEKAQRNGKESDQEFSCFEAMTHEDLLAFMNNKYDKYAAKSEEMEVKLNKIIMKRIATLKDGFINDHRKSLLEHIVQGGNNMTNEEYERLTVHGIHPNHQQYKFDFKGVGNIRFVAIDFNGVKTDRKAKTWFFCDKLPEECSEEVSVKRLKKEAIQVLTHFIAFKDKVRSSLNNI